MKLAIDYSRFIEHCSNETTYEDSKEKEKVKRGGGERKGRRFTEILDFAMDKGYSGLEGRCQKRDEDDSFPM